MALSNPVKDLRRPSLQNSTYRGQVVDNNDPEKRQRVKLRIPQLHRDIPDEDLPWSMPSSAGMPHSGGGVGSVDVPPKGAMMESWFEEDDPHNPRFGGSPPLDTVHKDNEILNEDYPKTSGHVDEFGNKWTVNKQRGEVLFQHKSGGSMFWDGAGNLSINSPGSITLNGAQGLNMTGGNIKMETEGEMKVKAKPVKLNPAGDTSIPSAPAPRNTPTTANASGKTSA